MMRSLVKLSLGQLSVCNNLNASGIGPAINFLRPIGRATESNASRTVPTIERWGWLRWRLF